MLSAGGLLIVGRLVWRWHAVGDLVATGHGVVGGIGLTVLSILYLPNAIVGAAAVLVGAAAHVGPAGGDLFAASPGNLPPLPILAVVPSAAPTLAPVLLVLTAVGAVVTATRTPFRGLIPAVRLAAAIGGLMAIAMVVLTWLAGGTLGEMGTAGATIPAAGLFTFGWWFVVGVVVALVRVALPSTRRELRERAWDDEFAAEEHAGHAHDEIDGWDDPPTEDVAALPQDSPQIAADDSPTVDIDPDDAPQRAPASLVFADHDLDDRRDDDRR